MERNLEGLNVLSLRIIVSKWPTHAISSPLHHFPPNKDKREKDIWRVLELWLKRLLQLSGNTIVCVCTNCGGVSPRKHTQISSHWKLTINWNLICVSCFAGRDKQRISNYHYWGNWIQGEISGRHLKPCWDWHCDQKWDVCQNWSKTSKSKRYNWI